MNETVADLVDMARIDGQTLEICSEPVSAAQLIESAGRKSDKALQERHLSLNLTVPPDLPFIRADPYTLKKVFSHLIENAIKNTPDGGSITISGRLITGNEEKPARDEIQLTISDTGIGIDRQHQQLIFTKFYRVEDASLHSSGKTKFKGAGPGLGLAIARGIVKAHGGKIWVESAGRDETTCPGSHFHIALPKC